jgi:hypothetical protein
MPPINFGLTKTLKAPAEYSSAGALFNVSSVKSVLIRCFKIKGTGFPVPIDLSFKAPGRGLPG